LSFRGCCGEHGHNDEGELPLELFDKVLVAWHEAVVNRKNVPEGHSWEVDFPDP